MEEIREEGSIKKTKNERHVSVMTALYVAFPQWSDLIRTVAKVKPQNNKRGKIWLEDASKILKKIWFLVSLKKMTRIYFIKKLYQEIYSLSFFMCF